MTEPFIDRFKHIILLLIVATLFTTLAYSIGEAITDRPDYADHCGATKPYFYPEKTTTNCTSHQPTDEQYANCQGQEGNLEPIYDDEGCIADYNCNTCQALYDQARKDYRFTLFLVLSLLGITAIILMLLITPGTDTTKWIFNGFLLGGLVSLFIGTVIYYADAPKLLRPVILLVELTLVIFIALRKTTRKKL